MTLSFVVLIFLIFLKCDGILHRIVLNFIVDIFTCFSFNLVPTDIWFHSPEISFIDYSAVKWKIFISYSLYISKYLSDIVFLFKNN